METCLAAPRMSPECKSPCHPTCRLPISLCPLRRCPVPGFSWPLGHLVAEPRSWDRIPESGYTQDPPFRWGHGSGQGQGCLGPRASTRLGGPQQRPGASPSTAQLGAPGPLPALGLALIPLWKALLFQSLIWVLKFILVPHPRVDSGLSPQRACFVESAKRCLDDVAWASWGCWWIPGPMLLLWLFGGL